MTDQTTEKSLAALDAVPKTYEDAVRALAAAHAAGVVSMEIYCLPDPQKRIVRLIEVSDSFPDGAVERPSSSGATERVVPVFPLGPARDFPYRSEVAQVTSAEWAQLRQGTLKLNRDWGNLASVKKVADGD
jgi:hypothetical protein